MRLVGTMTEEGQARTFTQYLQAREVPAVVRPVANAWSIWVQNEDQVAQGLQEFEAFRAASNDPRYADAIRAAAAARKDSTRSNRDLRRELGRMRGRVASILPGHCTLVYLLIGVCVATALYTSLGTNRARLMPLYFSPPTRFVIDYDLGNGITQSVVGERSSGFEPIKGGEVWRLFTPMLIHYGWPHLIFNMLALYTFGGLIENRKGPLVFLALVLTAAPFSFVCQHLWDIEQHGPAVISLPGGMSGVVYALFGYLWMAGEYAPESGLRLNTTSIAWMLGWLFLCFTGALGPIANAAHVSGLVFGMLIGLAPHLIGSRHASGTDSSP